MQRHLPLPVASLLLANALGCAGPGTEGAPSRATTLALVGGTPDYGDPAVVLLEATGPEGGECTAVFVSTTVLLTAAHCVLDERGGPLDGAGFRIYFGHDLAQATASDWTTIDPSQVHPHPAFAGDDHDLAVLLLDEPAAVAPLPLGTAKLSRSDIGKPVRLVGYGANVAGASDDADGFGVKRELHTTIAGVDASFVEVGEQGHTACGGDSGGPALLSVDGVETIVGLDSYSDAAVDCTQSELYQRVDVEADFIAPFLVPSADDGDGGAGGDGEVPPDADTPPESGAPGPSSGCAANGRLDPQPPPALAALLFAFVRRRAPRRRPTAAS